MNRREFCKTASFATGSLILSPLINACARQKRAAPGSPAATATQTMNKPTDLAQTAPPARPTSLEEATITVSATSTVPAQATTTPITTSTPANSMIALVKGQDRASGVARAIDLLNPEPLRGKNVLLKPNFNSADPPPGSTHIETLRSLLDQLLILGAGQVILADRSGMGNTRQVMEQIGIFKLAAEYGCQTVVFEELSEKDWVIYHQPGSHWQNGFPVPRILLEAEAIVQTCNLKTHRYGGHFTMSLKNSVGFVAKRMQAGGHNYMTELHNSPYQRLMIAEINAAYRPDLVVMDGVEAFVEGGPAQGKKVSPGVVLAGYDRVALDAVGVAILRAIGTTPEVNHGRVFEQEQIARAAELGLGAGGPEQIDFVTANAESAALAAEVRQLLLA